MQGAQLARHLLHRGVAPLGLLGQHAVHHCRQARGHFGVGAQHRLGLAGDDLVQHRVQRLAPERLLQREELVEHGPGREQVRARVDGAALGLLGRHVVGRAQDHAAARDAGARAQARQAEVQQLDLPARADQDVGRLDVAVHDAARVGVAEAGADLQEDAHALGQGDRRLALDQRAQVVALEQLHGHVEPPVGLVHVVDADDVGMAQLADRLDLATEALVQLFLGGELLGEHLERHRPAQGQVAGAVDHAHGAFAQLVEDLVTAEGGHGRGLRRRGAAAPPRRCRARRPRWRRRSGAWPVPRAAPSRPRGCRG